MVFCNRKLELNLEATVLSRDPEAFKRRMPHLDREPALQWLKGDIRDFVFPDGISNTFFTVLLLRPRKRRPAGASC